TKRWSITAICVALAISRLVWPDIKVDEITIALVIVAASMLFLPELQKALPHIKRVKLWDLEVETKDQVAQLGERVDSIRDTTAKAAADSSAQSSADIADIS